MEPITKLLVATLAGGLVFAILLTLRRHHDGVPDSVPRVPASSDIIDISRVHVAGIGGLGPIAAAIVVAIFLPPVRMALVIGGVLGAVLGVVLILRRA